MLHLLQMDRFLANVFVLFSGLGANERDVRYRQQEPDAERAAVIELARVQLQTSRLMALPSQFDFVGLDLGVSRSGRFQQRGELRKRPFTRAKIAKPSPHKVGRVDLKGLAK